MVQHHNELGVGKHGTGLHGIQQILHVLGDGRRIGVSLTELSPSGIEELGGELIFKHHMELINKDMGSFASLPVQRYSVQHGIGDHQKAGGLQLCSQTMNVEDNHSLVQIHIALLAEDIQRTGGIELQRQIDLLCFRLRLREQLLSQSAERRDRRSLVGLFIDLRDTAVDDGLVLRSHAFLIDLLDQGHDELRLHYDRIVLSVAVYHIHGIQTVPASS